jgi:hypothetical protein
MHITQRLHRRLDRELGATNVDDAICLKHTKLDRDGGTSGCAGHQAFEAEGRHDTISVRIQLDLNADSI